MIKTDPTKNDSVLTVADIRAMMKQLKSALYCPQCKHKPHRAYACGMKNPALSREGDRIIGHRTCDCNVTFELTPIKIA